MKSNYQYYVEVIPHAIRRIRERFINNFQEAYYAVMKAQDLVDTAVFSLHEIGLFFKTGKIRNGIFYPNIDEDGNTHGVVLLKRSMFYARMTPLGNFIFKTFINPQAEKGTMKQEFIHMIFSIYMSYNLPKEQDTEENRLKYMTAAYVMAPRMRRYLDHYSEVFVPLFP